MDTESNNLKQKQDKLHKQAVKIWFFILAFFMIAMCLIMYMNFGLFGVGLILLITLILSAAGWLMAFLTRKVKLFNYVLITVACAVFLWGFGMKNFAYFVFFLAGLILLKILVTLFISLVNNVVLLFDANYKKASEAYKMCNFRNAILYYEEFIKDKHKLKKRSFIIYRLIMLYCYFEEYDKALAILNQYKDFYSDAVVNLNLSLLKISILNEQKSLSEVYAEMENLKGIIEGININTIKKSAEQTYELLKIEVLLSEDEIDKAIDCFNSIPKKHQDESYYILKGHIARKQNNLEDAAKSYLYCYTKTKDPLKKAFYLKSILEREK